MTEDIRSRKINVTNVWRVHMRDAATNKYTLLVLCEEKVQGPAFLAAVKDTFDYYSETGYFAPEVRFDDLYVTSTELIGCAAGSTKRRVSGAEVVIVKGKDGSVIANPFRWAQLAGLTSNTPTTTSSPFSKWVDPEIDKQREITEKLQEKLDAERHAKANNVIDEMLKDTQDRLETKGDPDAIQAALEDTAKHMPADEEPMCLLKDNDSWEEMNKTVDEINRQDTDKGATGFDGAKN